MKGGLVNASGDLAAWGRTLEGLPWNIGVQHPEETENPLTFIQIEEGSVATSGNYEKYSLIDGKRYGHIINPLTGIPSRELISVTIIGPFAEFANFLSTSMMVLGEEKGLNLIRQFPEYTYLIVKNDGQVIQNICLE